MCRMPLASALIPALICSSLLCLYSKETPASEITRIQVQEALPGGVSGMARSAAPVTVGIPLPQNSGITSVTQLGLSGTTKGQFRPLAWWPNGSVKWVLVDFQTDLTAGGTHTDVALVTGSGNFGGANLASDAPSSIAIDTGAAQFQIKKANFNLFDAVTIGGQTLVTPGNSGALAAVGADNVIYTSSNDSSATAIIEENGPLRSVVRATGSLKSASGDRLMDYTLRLHFYKGSTQVKGIVTLRNALLNPKTHAVFKSVEAIVPVSIADQKIVSFSRTSDLAARTLDGADTAFLYQGYNTKQLTTQDKDCFNYTPPIPGTCPANFVFQPNVSYQGLTIQAGSEVLNSPGNLAEASQGYADFGNAAGEGVAVAFRWLSGYWPGGFEFKGDGTTSIELYSKHNGGTNIKLSYGRHDTREVMWDFHVTPRDAKGTLYALQYPLIARAPLELYKQSEGLFGQSQVVSTSEQQNFFSTQGKAPPAFSNPSISTIFRSWQWSKPGGANQIQFPFIDMFEFLRTGHAGYFLRGEQRTVFNLDSAIGFSDDYVGFNRMSPPATDPYPALKGLAGGLMDTEHAHAVSIPFYYFMTGNEGIKEGFLDAGETFQKNNDVGYYPIPNTPYIRAWSWQIRNLAIAYEFSCQVGSCNNTLKTTIINAVTSLVDSREDGSGTTRGRNMERGFLFWNDLSNGSRKVHSEYYTQMHFDAMWQVWRVMNQFQWNYARMLDFEDYLTGMSQFIFHELIRPVRGDDVFYGFPVDYTYTCQKDYLIDTFQPVPEPAARVFDASRPAVWGYQHTGDSTMLDKGYALLWGLYEEVPQNPSELQDQQLMWLYFNKNSVPTWKPLTITKIANGGGSYTLRWTVPVGAQAFQVKYSDKPIVETLGFSRDTRAFQYDPLQYTAFFAAKNVASNPVPSSTGSTQDFAVTGLDPAKEWYFFVKYLALDSGPADTEPPVITSFTVPANSTSLAVSVTAFSATDNIGVTGYIITESPTAPSLQDNGWSAVFPSSFTFSAGGNRTLYAWTRDSAGNVSSSVSRSIVITLPDSTSPVVTSFIMPATAAALEVPITALIATDNVGITGYMVTESPTVPQSEHPAWSLTKPALVTFLGSGIRSAYAWVKDAAGNVSASVVQSVTITLPDTSAPNVSISSPSHGTTLQGSVAISTSASDNIGVTKVEIYVDGTLYATKSEAPYDFTWNTLTVSSGNHTLVAKAYDAVNNVATSAAVTIRVRRTPKAPILQRIE